MTDYWDLQKKQVKLRGELDAVEEKLKSAKQALTENPIFLVAEALHKQLCRHNHTDGCAWYYEKWETPGAERMRWVNIARRVIPLLRQDPGPDAQDQTEYIVKLIDAATGNYT